jgi:hypothetical protein
MTDKNASNPTDIAEVIYDLVTDLDFIEKEKIVPIITELIKLHSEEVANIASGDKKS